METSIAEWQRQIESWNADRLKTDQFIQLVKRYTDFSELTSPMLNEFIEKVIVHEGEGRRNDRRQREEQAAKEVQSKELEKARYEKHKAEKREFTARKKAGGASHPGRTGSGGKAACTHSPCAAPMNRKTMSAPLSGKSGSMPR